jgi:hypothetical protein
MILIFHRFRWNINALDLAICARAFACVRGRWGVFGRWVAETRHSQADGVLTASSGF